jgi:hypothetical protein
MMNLLQERIPDKIPKKFNRFLPWPQQIVQQVMDSKKNNTPMPKYQSLFADLDSKGSDGGKLTYVTKTAVMDMINGGEIPEFEAVVLEILDYNFIQQYATYQGNKTGVVAFSTQWPAKLDGRVTMESKSGGTDPTKGGFSFKLSPKNAPMPKADELMGDDDELELPKASAGPEGNLADYEAPRSKIKARREPEGDVKSLGRKRR